jgi:hypothetical protein
MQMLFAYLSREEVRTQLPKKIRSKGIRIFLCRTIYLGCSTLQWCWQPIVVKVTGLKRDSIVRLRSPPPFLSHHSILGRNRKKKVSFANDLGNYHRLFLGPWVLVIND